METQIFQQEIQEILDKQIAARAALAALPEDTPEAIKKSFSDTAEQADAAVATLNEQILACDTYKISKHAFKATLRELKDSLGLPGAEKNEASDHRTRVAAICVLLLIGVFTIFAMIPGQGPDTYSRASRQGNPQASYKFTVSVRDGSALTKTAAQNIACQRAGFAGAVLEDIECFPDSFGSCARAEITLACTRSQAAQQQNIRTLREFAETLR